MSQPNYDVVAIGNAIVDVLSPAEDGFIADNGMTKGAMQLIFSPEDADALYAKMGPGQEISGGSAANTVAGMAQLGGKCAFIGQVADDQLGQVFAHDIRAGGIRFDTEARSGAPPPAAASSSSPPTGSDDEHLPRGLALPARTRARPRADRRCRLSLHRGVSVGPEEPRAAMRAAIGCRQGSRAQGRLTTSAEFVIDRHRADFLDLIDGGQIDLISPTRPS